MFKFWQLHYVFTCGVVDLSCFMLQQEISLLIWRALRWNCGSLSTSPRKKEVTRSWDLVSRTPSWGTYQRKINNKVKVIIIIHVCNEFDMRFWCFWWGNGVIFNNMNSEFLRESFIVFFSCGNFRMCVWWEEKGRDIMMFCYDKCLCRPALVWW